MQAILLLPPGTSTSREALSFSLHSPSEGCSPPWLVKSSTSNGSFQSPNAKGGFLGSRRRRRAFASITLDSEASARQQQTPQQAGSQGEAPQQQQQPVLEALPIGTQRGAVVAFMGEQMHWLVHMIHDTTVRPIPAAQEHWSIGALELSHDSSHMHLCILCVCSTRQAVDPRSESGAMFGMGRRLLQWMSSASGKHTRPQVGTYTLELCLMGLLISLV